MYTKHNSESSGADTLHYPEIDLADEWSSICSRCKRAKDRDLVTDIRSLLLGERNEGFRGTLTVSDESKLRKASLRENSTDECR